MTCSNKANKRPVKKNFELYKGTTFTIQFRIKSEGNYLPLDEYGIYFTASDKVGGTVAFSKSDSASPTEITVDVDDDYLVTVQLSPTETGAISQKGSLYYEIDLVDNAGQRVRWLLGEIILHEQAEE